MTANLLVTREELERAVAVVVRDYGTFIGKGSPEPHDDPKVFATWHTSARAALGHLEQLMKVIKAAGGEPSDEAAEILAQALNALGTPEDEEDREDGGT
ncbi:hypothetical protein ACQW02_00575 [Humitalea sp. 24SJ18S-53]|uniref:hypothetical protein n=1 Tax=Humitalea sp. 24SJ18S-53 TaxID=3422307 RepID=UPI003D67E82A